MIMISKLMSASATVGDGMEMDAIAAVVIGGTSMEGGEWLYYRYGCRGIDHYRYYKLDDIAGYQSLLERCCKRSNYHHCIVN